MRCEVIGQVEVVVTGRRDQRSLARNLDPEVVDDDSVIGVSHAVPSQAKLPLAFVNFCVQSGGKKLV